MFVQPVEMTRPYMEKRGVQLYAMYVYMRRESSLFVYTRIS